jgi:hypothetical protein
LAANNQNKALNFGDNQIETLTKLATGP